MLFSRYRNDGLVFIRYNGGHECWNYPDKTLKRPITFQSHFKYINSRMVNSNIQTMGVGYNDFIKEIQMARN